ncbi:RluA family pseudouridine synthase [Kordiimonas marina]|uniref:RluA family pseudouridine synthase n=1 Tax=Kordiimonas marina TaxID=2872312 RepID=UPI001FF4D999|nr:RluA family pseudouridine synthase [Kordiimonas marina]MCJ9429266.1 RluA family pseudouridine synthase [Kordiimonas marina]
MRTVQNITVADDDHDVRLDRWFKRHFPDLSFIQLQKMCRKGEVRLDGHRVKPGDRIYAGQSVRVPPLGDRAVPKPDDVKPKAEHKLSDEDIKEVRSWVLYKDDQVIAINKPAGLATQGGTGQKRHLDGLLEALRYDSEHRPRLVHRLDKDTSGVLLLGRSANSAAALAKGFQSKETDKRYWALVKGVPHPTDGRIVLKMDKAPIKGGERMVVTEDGKKSMTDYAVVDSAPPEAAWLALKPHTGRTHQLRLHCAEMGHPIVGDGKYGGADAFLTGAISRKLHLHSQSVTFPHPKGGMMTVTAPLPPHMKESFAMLGFEVGEYEDPLQED